MVEEFTNPKFALDLLANHLNRGSLFLFLGAGVAKDFGLPSWLELINSLSTELSLPELTSPTSAELQERAEEIKITINDKTKLNEMVQTSLYKNLSQIDHQMALSNNLLVAISSMLFGSRRGRVKNIISLNYDSTFESFLNFYGFVVKPITKLPCDEGSEDVRIFHQHGYIPHPELNSKFSDDIILTLSHANDRISGVEGKLWNDKFVSLLQTKLCLFIGVSENGLKDSVIAPLIAKAHKEITGRPIGIMLSKDTMSKTIIKYFCDQGIAPLIINDSKEINKFILSIGQKASEKINNLYSIN